MTREFPLSGVDRTLAAGVPESAPGTLFALSLCGGLTMAPKDGRRLYFGRNRPDVHICVGEDDRRVSRRHGQLDYAGTRWWLHNTGRLPIRLPGSVWLHPGGEPVPLGDGYAPLFLRGSSGREHLLELFVVGNLDQRPRSKHADLTQPPSIWRLSEKEKLAVVVLGQRYLYHEANPQPLAWRQAAAALADLQPGQGWTAKRVEHLVAGIRGRLARTGVTGLTREEVGEPVGNSLNHNLLTELVLSTTIVPGDLEALGALID
ncbi:FHA domain-containing protein [Sciscionella sediminilitoris]|uniref:FHA domain-containing protein n=1 Tax=Sciscionella sediminilitoris TaxID=1445613 RepID=UPI0004DFBCFF|nr:FHA domain-containing protein [Sciscionella sp. SE31]